MVLFSHPVHITISSPVIELEVVLEEVEYELNQYQY